MPYIDPGDIRQHFRQSGALTDADISEFMAEEEYYIKTQLDLDPLPEDHPILKSIVRDLTIARCMLTLVPIQGEVSHADFLRREALRRLNELDRGGLVPSGPSTTTSPESEVYNPHTKPFWSLDEFGLE